MQGTSGDPWLPFFSKNRRMISPPQYGHGYLPVGLIRLET